MRQLFVLTGKADGGTQDVLGFYNRRNQAEAWKAAMDFIHEHRRSRRCIVRLEVYNPRGKPLPKSAKKEAESRPEASVN